MICTNADLTINHFISEMWLQCLIMIFLVFCGLLVFSKVSSVSAADGPLSFKSHRVICECGARIVETGRKAGLTLYTRNGVVLNAVHYEKRCRSCKRGYFYSFYTNGKYLYYEDTCLEQPYLITSRRTCFAVDLLYEWSLSILHHSSRLH